jgi:hypothetical protein
MNCNVIGIGGTGARCIEALIHLCAMGLGPEDLFILIIDPDSANGNLDRTRELILNYNKCRKAINPENASVTKTFSTRLHFGQNNTSEQLRWSPFGEKMTLGKLLQIYTREGWRDLCRAFYSDFELYELEWDVGFRGHASVASPAMATVMDHLKEHPWTDFCERTKTAMSTGEQRTFIFASAFGATGAGGFPVIPQILRRAASTEKWTGRDRFGIGGALVLPYYVFSTPADQKEKLKPGEYAQSRLFLMNTQAALLHYGRVWGTHGSPFDAVYYMGARDPDAIDREEIGGKFALGGKAQQNPAHFVELLAALAALHFYARPADYKIDEKDENRRDCKPHAAAGGKEDCITWRDLPLQQLTDAQKRTVNLKERMLSYLTSQAALVDYYLPLFQEPEFESRPWTSAWYYRNFASRTLTNADASTAFNDLKIFAERSFFPWLWQIHQTSQNRPLFMFNHNFLRTRCESKEKTTPEDRMRSFSNLLHPSGGEVSNRGGLGDGYTAIWNHLCSTRNAPMMNPPGRLWEMLLSASEDYVRDRYPLEAAKR